MYISDNCLQDHPISEKCGQSPSEQVFSHRKVPAQGSTRKPEQREILKSKNDKERKSNLR